MKRLVFLFLAVLVLANVPAVPVSASASTSVPTVRYVVQPGDTLASIGRQYCTTWQEIYNLNRATLGAYPESISPGMVLYVPNRCGGSRPPAPGVCDMGPSKHAHGKLAGNVYTVAFGDTMYSISMRFCQTVSQLAAANGIGNPWILFAGQRLVVSGQAPVPPPPSGPFLAIHAPTSGSILPATFTVSGTGRGLYEGNVVVQAKDSSNRILVQQSTTLQGTDVGTGGEGTWTVQLTVNLQQVTPGSIVAMSPGSQVAPASVAVQFGGSSQPVTPFIAIDQPTPGSTVPATFTVSGRGGGLVEGNVVVQAKASNGSLLAQQVTVLQGSDVGTGGQGTWSVQLSVNVAQGTPGTVNAYSPGSSASTSVQVVFGSGAPDYKDYPPGSCQIQARPGAPYFAYPGGPQTGQFTTGGLLQPWRGAKLNGAYWYMVYPDSGSANPPYWVPATSTTSASSGCFF